MKAGMRGFSLIEIAIGLLILGLVTSSLVSVVTQQTEQKRISDTTALLAQAQEAVMAFVTAAGRLPCPATPTSNGQEVGTLVGGLWRCSVEAGLLPAATLGLTPLDAQGLSQTPWGGGPGTGATYPFALRYAVTALAAPVTDALTSAGLGAPTQSTRRAEVWAAIEGGAGWFVCASASATGTGANRCGTSSNLLTNQAAAVIWALGANANDPSRYSADEAQNATVSVPRVIVSRNYAPVGAVGGGFDDQAVWIPATLVLDRLLTTGVVP